MTAQKSKTKKSLSLLKKIERLVGNDGEVAKENFQIYTRCSRKGIYQTVFADTPGIKVFMVDKDGDLVQETPQICTWRSRIGTYQVVFVGLPGIKAVVEGYHFNNDFTSRYVRLLIKEYPAYRGLFETRRLRSQ
jgi:hypothetical protein